MTWNRTWCWLWASPDGAILFSSRFKAAAYIEKLYPGGEWNRMGRDHVWIYSTDDDQFRIHREEVL